MNSLQSHKMELTQKHQDGCFNCGYTCSTQHIEKTELHINKHDSVVLHDVSLCESDWKHYQNCRETDEPRLAIGVLFSSKMVCVKDGNAEQVNTYKQSYMRNRTVAH